MLDDNDKAVDGMDIGDVDIVDDTIEEKLGGVVEERDVVRDKIGEIHDEVGGWEVEVCIEVVGVGVLVLGFSVNEHILLISPCDCSERE